MILVLSGTSDGRKIVKELLGKNLHVLASSATEYGGELLTPDPKLKVLIGRLDLEDMQDVIKEYGVAKIIDATHPYASVVSTNAMKACSMTKTPYYRYERKKVDYSAQDHVVSCLDYSEAINIINTTEGNVLLTTGSNQLSAFNQVNDLDRIFARVLPTIDSLEKCIKLGLKPKQIIGMQGPFLKSLNNAMIDQLDIKIIVTKESSKAGAFEEKLESALEKGCKLLVIGRPKIDYMNQYDDIDTLIEQF